MDEISRPAATSTELPATAAPTAVRRGTINNNAGLIWAIADLLRGDYKQSEYGRVILPLVVLRRLDCVLEPTKEQVRARLAALGGRVGNVGPILQAITGIEVYNTSPLTLQKILADPSQVAGNVRAWIAAFDPDTRDVIEKFDFDAQIGRLDRAKILYLVLSKVTDVDLHPDKVSNVEMGYLYEELIRKFSELSNETAGEHFTPREVVRLMVDLLFIEDDELLRTPGIVRTLLDPACGTGGMLSVAAEYLRELNPKARLEGYGQELNAETYALCRSDMMLKGQKASNIRLGKVLHAPGTPHVRGAEGARRDRRCERRLSTGGRTSGSRPFQVAAGKSDSPWMGCPNGSGTSPALEQPKTRESFQGDHSADAMNARSTPCLAVFPIEAGGVAADTGQAKAAASYAPASGRRPGAFSQGGR